MPDKRGGTLQLLIKREVTPAQTDIKIHTMSALMWLYLNIKDQEKKKNMMQHYDNMVRYIMTVHRYQSTILFQVCSQLVVFSKFCLQCRIGPPSQFSNCVFHQFYFCG